MAEPYFPYVPQLRHPDPANIGSLLYGNGAPSNSLGNNNDAYIDLSTGDIYYKEGDVWNITPPGGSGAIQVYTGAFDDPNGNVTPADTTKPAFYYKDTPENNQWRWIVNLQQWEQHFG